MASFEIGYIEQYCAKYDKTEWNHLAAEAAYIDGEDTFECPIFSPYACDCDKASELIKYKGFNLKNFDIYKNDSPYEPDLLLLETNKRIYNCFYLKMDGQILIDLRDDYKEGEVDE